MRWIFTLTVALALSLLAATTQAQTLLNQLEQRLQPGSLPAAGGAAPSAPDKGYLGAELDDAAESGRGVKVNWVRPDGPAEKGGLKADDVITSVGSTPVKSLDDFDAVLDKAKPNQKLQLMVVRGGRNLQVTITLGTKPPAGEPPAAELPAGAAPTLLPPGTASPATPGGATPTTLPSILPATPAPGALSPPASGGIGSPSGRTTETIPPAVPGTSPLITTEPAPRTTLPSTPSTSPLSLGPAPGSAAGPGGSAITPLPSSGGGGSLGITVVDLSDQTRIALGVPVRRGAFISLIKPGSPAELAGLPPNGVIVAMDGRKIDSANDLVKAIQGAAPGQEVELTYYEGNALNKKSVRLAPAGSVLVAPSSSPAAGPAIGSAGPGPAPARENPAPFGTRPPGERPLISRAERMIDNFSRGGGGIGSSAVGPTTVYDPSVMAALQARVSELTAEVSRLEERLRAIEGRQGGVGSGGTTPHPSGGSAVPGTSPMP